MNIRLKRLLVEDIAILDLIFEEQYDGFFKENSKSSAAKKQKYKEFLIEVGTRLKTMVVIMLDDVAAGFIICSKDGLMISGLKSEYGGKGIMLKARNTFVYLANVQANLYNIHNRVDPSNTNMIKFLEKIPHDKVDDGEDLIYYTYYDTSVELIPYGDINFAPRLGEIPKKLYHISFDSKLPQVLIPKQPDGIEKNSQGDYPEILPDRVSFSPSIGKCFRAVYANISGLMEGSKEKSINFHLYRAKNTKGITVPPYNSLIEGKIHDAHITSEYYSTAKTEIEYIGTIEVANTSDDAGLMYQPFMRDKARYHSPRIVDIKVKLRKRASFKDL